MVEQIEPRVSAEQSTSSPPEQDAVGSLQGISTTNAAEGTRLGLLGDNSVPVGPRRRFTSRTDFFVALWLLFLVLVAAGVHGSSIACAIERWFPGSHYSGYLFPRIANKLPFLDVGAIGAFALDTSRLDRSDEWLKNTPPALGQFNHDPKFPIVNTNIGDGQNMLAWMPNTPVWHITALARPATWGYFFLGPQRGLAWAWWFPLFGCFTALTLLLELMLSGHFRIAAFGAFWFCASAYTVCWSLWPAYVVFFGALCCFAIYHLLTTDKRRVMLGSAVVAGLSVPGAIMFLYPAWLVSVGYLFLLILAGLLIQRTRAMKSRDTEPTGIEEGTLGSPQRNPAAFGSIFLARLVSVRRDRLVALAVFVALAVGLCISFAWTCWPAFKVMAGTVYPGHRRSAGGGYGLSDLFKGFYNLHTGYTGVRGFDNTSEAASFFYLFPAVLAGLIMSARLRRELTLTGWLVLVYLVAMLFYSVVGVPQTLADLTLLSYVPSYRVDIGTGLASIILCMIVVSRGRAVFSNATDSGARTAPALAAGAGMPLFLLSGMALANRTFGFPTLSQAIAVSLVVTLVSYFMMLGAVKAFCGVLAVGILMTTALFNPLATNLDQIYDSELALQIKKINNENNRPLWLCYGPGETSELVTLLGGRSISGFQWPPQVRLWRDLDPAGSFDEQYNRDAWVFLRYQDSREPVIFLNPNRYALEVRVSPDNPVLIARGAKYILATGNAQMQIDRSKYPLVYKSPSDTFTIFTIAQ